MSGLRAVIEGEIRERGPIPFSHYMESCLYHPQFGYYSRSGEQFGKAGDFYTSSDVHAVFGRLLARQFEEMWRALGSPERIVIKELGPGRGLFAQDVMDWAEKKFPEGVTAFRPEMAVHGRYGMACPRCGEKVLRIRYADKETNYCAKCQTGGKVLADRSLSRLLGSDWPRSLDELEALKKK